MFVIDVMSWNEVARGTGRVAGQWVVKRTIALDEVAKVRVLREAKEAGSCAQVWDYGQHPRKAKKINVSATAFAATNKQLQKELETCSL